MEDRVATGVDEESSLLPSSRPPASGDRRPPSSSSAEVPRRMPPPPAVWATVDGPLWMPLEDAKDHVWRFFLWGFACLPFLWPINCCYFWPVLCSPKASSPTAFATIRPYKEASYRPYIPSLTTTTRNLSAMCYGDKFISDRSVMDLVDYLLTETKKDKASAPAMAASPSKEACLPEASRGEAAQQPHADPRLQEQAAGA